MPLIPDVSSSNPADAGNSPQSVDPAHVRSEKVVIQFGNRKLKGYLESPEWNTIEQLLTNAPPHSPEKFRIRPVESDKTEEISTSDIKAVFYVESFEGNARHDPLNFHTRAPIIHGIWMRVKFIDGEVMEGIVYNSIRYLIDPGFFMLPTDPGSNNKLVYLMKSWLVDHRILGLRKIHASYAQSLKIE